ncbi:hypothetical protein DIPPA_08986 [Diplonema papillatum]|nr:hypothetical protein DIPPA_08986 [Diplonema papillatum]
MGGRLLFSPPSSLPPGSELPGDEAGCLLLARMEVIENSTFTPTRGAGEDRDAVRVSTWTQVKAADWQADGAAAGAGGGTRQPIEYLERLEALRAKHEQRARRQCADEDTVESLRAKLRRREQDVLYSVNLGNAILEDLSRTKAGQDRLTRDLREAARMRRRFDKRAASFLATSQHAIEERAQTLAGSTADLVVELTEDLRRARQQASPAPAAAARELDRETARRQSCEKECRRLRARLAAQASAEQDATLAVEHVASVLHAAFSTGAGGQSAEGRRGVCPPPLFEPAETGAPGARLAAAARAMETVAGGVLAAFSRRAAEQGGSEMPAESSGLDVFVVCPNCSREATDAGGRRGAPGPGRAARLARDLDDLRDDKERLLASLDAARREKDRSAGVLAAQAAAARAERARLVAAHEEALGKRESEIGLLRRRLDTAEAFQREFVDVAAAMKQKLGHLGAPRPESASEASDGARSRGGGADALAQENEWLRRDLAALRSELNAVLPAPAAVGQVLDPSAGGDTGSPLSDSVSDVSYDDCPPASDEEKANAGAPSCHTLGPARVDSEPPGRAADGAEVSRSPLVRENGRLRAELAALRGRLRAAADDGADTPQQGAGDWTRDLPVAAGAAPGAPAHCRTDDGAGTCRQDAGSWTRALRPATNAATPNGACAFAHRDVHSRGDDCDDDPDGARGWTRSQSGSHPLVSSCSGSAPDHGLVSSRTSDAGQKQEGSDASAARCHPPAGTAGAALRAEDFTEFGSSARDTPSPDGSESSGRRQPRLLAENHPSRVLASLCCKAAATPTESYKSAVTHTSSAAYNPTRLTASFHTAKPDAHPTGSRRPSLLHESPYLPPGVHPAAQGRGSRKTTPRSDASPGCFPDQTSGFSLPHDYLILGPSETGDDTATVASSTNPANAYGAAQGQHGSLGLPFIDSVCSDVAPSDQDIHDLAAEVSRQRQALDLDREAWRHTFDQPYPGDRKPSSSPGEGREERGGNTAPASHRGSVCTSRGPAAREENEHRPDPRRFPAERARGEEAGPGEAASPAQDFPGCVNRGRKTPPPSEPGARTPPVGVGQPSGEPISPRVSGSAEARSSRRRPVSSDLPALKDSGARSLAVARTAPVSLLGRLDDRKNTAAFRGKTAFGSACRGDPSAGKSRKRSATDAGSQREHPSGRRSLSVQARTAPASYSGRHLAWRQTEPRGTGADPRRHPPPRGGAAPEYSSRGAPVPAARQPEAEAAVAIARGGAGAASGGGRDTAGSSRQLPSAGDGREPATSAGIPRKPPSSDGREAEASTGNSRQLPSSGDGRETAASAGNPLLPTLGGGRDSAGNSRHLPSSGDGRETAASAGNSRHPSSGDGRETATSAGNPRQLPKSGNGRETAASVGNTRYPSSSDGREAATSAGNPRLPPPSNEREAAASAGNSRQLPTSGDGREAASSAGNSRQLPPSSDGWEEPAAPPRPGGRAGARGQPPLPALGGDDRTENFCADSGSGRAPPAAGRPAPPRAGRAKVKIAAKVLKSRELDGTSAAGGARERCDEKPAKSRVPETPAASSAAGRGQRCRAVTNQPHDSEVASRADRTSAGGDDSRMSYEDDASIEVDMEDNTLRSEAHRGRGTATAHNHPVGSAAKALNGGQDGDDNSIELDMEECGESAALKTLSVKDDTSIEIDIEDGGQMEHRLREGAKGADCNRVAESGGRSAALKPLPAKDDSSIELDIEEDSDWTAPQPPRLRTRLTPLPPAPHVARASPSPPPPMSRLVPYDNFAVPSPSTKQRLLTNPASVPEFAGIARISPARSLSVERPIAFR